MLLDLEMLSSMSFVRAVRSSGIGKKSASSRWTKRSVSAPSKGARTLKRMFSSEQVEERLKAHGLEWPGPVRCVCFSELLLVPLLSLVCVF